MAVGPKGEQRGAVAQPLLNDLVAGSVLEQEAGAGVAQAIEAESLRHMGFFAVAANKGGYMVRAEGRSVQTWEQ